MSYTSFSWPVTPYSTYLLPVMNLVFLSLNIGQEVTLFARGHPIYKELAGIACK
jgi:choline-glycine betaine transporter